jgi:hypothetical protein
MNTYQLVREKDHLFVTLPDGSRQLLDTGAGHSLGTAGSVTVAGVTVPVTKKYLGASVRRLRKLVGADFSGLLGLDVLGQLDAVYDLPAGTVTFSRRPGLAVEGEAVSLRAEPFGLPLFTGRVRGRPRTWALDTGAQLSYFLPEEDDLSVFPFAGKAPDFFPLTGKYTVDTYRVPVTLGEASVTVSLRAAVPPRLLQRLLAGFGGLVGAELFAGRKVGFFPLQRRLVVGPREAAAAECAA